MARIASVIDIIRLWPSAETFGRDLGLKYPSYARVMMVRGRIPPVHWPKVIAAAEMRELPVDRASLEAAHRKDQQMVEATA